MNEFVRVGSLSDFELGAIRAVAVGEVPVAVVNVGGELHAISDFCPHEGISLSGGYGYVQERMVRCLLHSSLFDIDTGDVFSGPAAAGLAKYTVKIEEDDVFVSTSRTL